MGQSTHCHYLVSSASDVLNVEVVKFPEFRGFWSENLALRQGPISLVPLLEDGFLGGLPQFNSLSKKRNPLKHFVIPRSTNLPVERQALVGTYLISAMIDKKDTQILPMKIKVESPLNAGHGNTAEELLISSEMPEIKILELPPVPAEFSGIAFNGAVGSFAIHTSETKVPFQPNEPTNLRITIQGKGNFAELNQLPLQLPKNIELLNHHSYTQGAGDYAAKAFEYSIVVHSPANSKETVRTELGNFLYFNPELKKYQNIELPHLELVPTPAVIENWGGESFKLPPPEKWPTVSRQWHQSLIFWIVQGLLSLIALGRIIQVASRLRKEALANSPEVQRAKKWNKVEQLVSEGKSEAYLKVAAELTSDLLKSELGNPVPTPHTQSGLLKLAKSKLSEERYGSAVEIFKNHDKIYSGDAVSASPRVKELLKKLLTR